MKFRDKVLLEIHDAYRNCNRSYMEKVYSKWTKTENIDDYIQAVGELLDLGYLKKIKKDSYFYDGYEWDLVPEGILLTAQGIDYSEEISWAG